MSVKCKDLGDICYTRRGIALIMSASYYYYYSITTIIIITQNQAEEEAQSTIQEAKGHC